MQGAAWNHPPHALEAWQSDPRQRQHGYLPEAQQLLAPWARQRSGEEKEGQQESSDGEEERALKLDDYLGHPLRLHEQRPSVSGCQRALGIGFYVQLALQLLIWLALWSSQNSFPKAPDGSCPSGYQELDAICVSNHLYEQQRACKTELAITDDATTTESKAHVSSGGGQEEDSETDHTHQRMSDMMKEHAEVFGVLLPLTLMMCAAWLVLMIFAAGPITWGMFVVDVLVMFWIFYHTSNWMMLVTAAALGLVVFFMREQIGMAVAAMRVAGRALLAAPGVFPLCALLMLVWFAYAACFYSLSWVMLNGSSAVGERCDLEPTVIALLFALWCPLTFLVTSFFIKNCMLAVISLAVGSFYFSDNARELDITPSRAAMVGLELALTRSSGSVFMASLLMGVVEYIRRAGERGFCACFFWCDPSWWLAKALWCAFQGLLNTLSRFGLIAHLFQGDRLCAAGSITCDVLRRQLPGVVVTGCVADAAMGHVAVVLSTAVGFGVWLYLDAAEQLGIFRSIGHGIGELLEPPKEGADDDGPSGKQVLSFIILLVTMLMLKAMRNPVQTLILTYVANHFLEVDDPQINSFCFALIVASLVSVIVHFFGHIMEYAADAVYYCSAMEAESGARQLRFNDFYRTMKQPELLGSAADED